METGATSEQRAAYAQWLLADEAALEARDAVLRAVQSGQALFDLDEFDRLCALADALRRRADVALDDALIALRLGPTLLEGSSELAWYEAGSCGFRFVDVIRAIVDIEVHQIGQRAKDRIKAASTGARATERHDLSCKRDP